MVQARRTAVAGPSNVVKSICNATSLAPVIRILEHVGGNGDVGHLEGGAVPLADDLGTDLDQLLVRARQRNLIASRVASGRRKLPRL